MTNCRNKTLTQHRCAELFVARSPRLILQQIAGETPSRIVYYICGRNDLQKGLPGALSGARAVVSLVDGLA